MPFEILRFLGRVFRALLALLEISLVRLIWLLAIARLPRNPSPKNILVFGYMGIGDFILFSPTLKAFKKKFPACRLTLLTGPYSSASELAPTLPQVDEILNIDWVNAGLLERIRINRELRSRRFDALVGTYTAPIRFFLPGLFLIPLRIGHCRKITYPKAWRRPLAFLKWRIQFEFIEEEFFKRLLFNKKVFITQEPIHEIDKGLRLVEALAPGKPFERTPTLNIPAQSQPRAQQLLQGLGVKPTDNLIGIHVAASQGQRWKQWPLERYGSLCEKLIGRWPVKLLFLGTQQEKKEITDNFSGLEPNRIVYTMGKTSLLETAALLKYCKLFVGGDSGLGHLAIAVGTPTIRIFGPSDEPGYVAWQGTHHTDIALELECRPCLVSGLLRPGVLNYANCPHKNCLNQLSVEIVYQQVSQKLTQIGIRNATPQIYGS